jgi:hypothetical protein
MDSVEAGEPWPRLSASDARPHPECSMISLSIFQPIRQWADAEARDRRRQRSLEQLQDEVRLLLLREKRI